MALDQRVDTVQKVALRVMRQNDPESILVAQRLYPLGIDGAYGRQLHRFIAHGCHPFQSSTKVCFILAVGTDRVKLSSKLHIQ